jgi:hypothetical protein
LKNVCVFGCLACMHLPKEKLMQLRYTATPGIFVGYGISTTQYFVYDLSATMLHHFRDVIFRAGTRNTAPNAAHEAFLNDHFYRDVIVESTLSKKQCETSQPTGDGNCKCQTVEPLENNSPPDPSKPKTKKLRQMAGLELSSGDAWKPPVEGSHRDRGGNLAEPGQLSLDDAEFKDMIPISAVAAISDDHENGIDDPMY